MKQREEFGLAQRKKETRKRSRGKEVPGSAQRWIESKEKKRERAGLGKGGEATLGL